MKKLLPLAVAALLIFAAASDQLPFDGGDRLRALATKVALPFKFASLAASAPDRALRVPVDGVGVKQIDDSWNAPRSGGRRHEGQDIFAKRGTAVRPAADGYVVRVGQNPIGGNVVFVVGAGRRVYYYAHLDSFALDLAVGDYVTAESVIGYVGNTGNAANTPAHLHFGVYESDGPIDPLPLLLRQPPPAK